MLKLDLSYIETEDTEESIELVNNLKKMSISRSFFKTLPKDLQPIVKEIKEKTKEQCQKFKKTDSGAFGSIKITKGKVQKVLNLLQEKQQKILLRDYKILKKKSQLYFLINRLNNYCKDIKDFLSVATKLFPNNFVKIYKCNLCSNKDNKPPNVYVEMAIGKGKNLKEVIKQKSLSQEQLNSIFIQIEYISLTLNHNKYYHNDLNPANIIIGKSKKNIIYKKLKNKNSEIILSLPKNNYYPIIIDYDLVSKNKPNYVESSELISPGSPDMSFFKTTTSNADKKQKNYLKKFKDFDKRSQINKSIKIIYENMKSYNNKILKITYVKKK